MWLSTVRIKNFLVCLAILASGFSYSGFAGSPGVNSGVVTELYSNRNHSVQSTTRCFSYRIALHEPISIYFPRIKHVQLLFDEANKFTVGFNLHQKISLSLEPLRRQPLVIYFTQSLFPFHSLS